MWVCRGSIWVTVIVIGYIMLRVSMNDTKSKSSHFRD